MKKNKIRPIVSREIASIISDKIAIDELPQEYKIGMGFLKAALIDYVLKSPNAVRGLPDWVKTITATKIREWYNKGLITKSQANELIAHETRNW